MFYKLAEIWSQIPVTPKLDKTPVYAAADWLETAQPGDVVIIQGEVGSTFMLVDYALKNK